MSKTKRLSYRLHEGEALVLGMVEDFEHLIVLFDALAIMPDYSPSEQQGWLKTSAWFRDWIDRTAQHADPDGEEWA